MRPALQIGIAAALALGGLGIWYVMSGSKGPAAGAGGPGGPGGRPVAVVAAKAVLGDVDVTFDAVGTLRANEAVTITSKLSGLIKVIRFDEGQQVAAGAVLAELDDNEARAELEVAEAQRRTVSQDLERAVALLGRQVVAQARVDDLKSSLQGAEARANAARARLQDLTIRAPFDGVAGLRQVSPGALVRPGDILTTLDDVDPLKLEFNVPETALRSLTQGMAIRTTSTVWPGEVFTGAVSAIDTRVDPISRTISVVAALPNPGLKLKPGMFMTVGLQLETRKGVVMIPEEALVPIGDRQFVFAVVDGKVQRRVVRIGARLSGRVEVIEGLKVDELVVTRGTQKVRDGAPVNATVDEAKPAARPASQS